jgi:hypothetical protein
MNKKSLGVLGLVLVVGASWMWMYRTLDSNRIDLDPYQALGRGAARETARFLRNSGRIVLVDASFGEFKILAPVTEAQVKAFKKAAGKTGLKIAAVEKVAIVPPSMGRSGIFMQPGQLPSLLGRYADVDAVVLFVGLASQDDIKASLQASGKAKLVLVANYEPHYKRLLESGVIQLAFVPQEGDGKQVSEGGSSDSFERDYLVVTPKNAAQLPD